MVTSIDLSTPNRDNMSEGALTIREETAWELEDGTGYWMSEEWNFTTPDLQYDGYWEDHLTQDIPTIKRRLQRWPTNL
jgi:hypothetical protein